MRRWLGSSRAELRAEAEVWRRRCERKDVELREAHARAKEHRRMAGEHRARVNELVEQLANAKQKLALAGEPAGGCGKVRLHRRADAEEWAELIVQRTNGPSNAMTAYQCRSCPRSPVTLSRYWHVGHPGTPEAQAVRRETKDRRKQAEAAANRNGLMIGQQIDPSVMAKLRELT